MILRALTQFLLHLLQYNFCWYAHIHLVVHTTSTDNHAIISQFIGGGQIRRVRGQQQQYYSCNILGYKVPLHSYTSVNNGQCTAFYHNPLSTDVWIASETTGEPVGLSLGRLPSQVLYNQLYSGHTFPGHIMS